MKFTPGRGIAGLAYKEGGIVNVGNVGEDARFVAMDAPSPYLSLIAIPIRSGDRVLGVLSVESKEKNAFLKHEEDLLSLFAGYAAIAIQHAEAYEGRVQAEKELKRYSERLESMVEERTVELKTAQVKLLNQQRLEQEVVLAAQVQASILPHRIPDLPGYEFAGIALAARYVSGDMYDWVSFSPEHCYFVLADIAGKGVPAAMMTSTARALLRNAAVRKSSPGYALSSLNRLLYDDLTHTERFITVVAANLDGRTATLDYANAGHTDGLWYRARAGVCERLPATGPPIGVLADNVLDEKRIFLCPSDVLVFYSDGVTEAERGENEFFGIDRLVDLLQRNAALPAAALAQTIVKAVDTFSGEPRSDDLTIIVVKALPRTVTFRSPGDFEHMEETMELIRALGRAYDADFAFQLELAACEIITNIIKHSYQNSHGEMRGEVRLEMDRVQLDLYDDGLVFDVSSLPMTAPFELSESGYGVHIARQLVDEIGYSPATSAGNHWRLVKIWRRENSDGGQ